MLHERDVIPVVKPQLTQVLTEFLAGNEKLFVAGEAAGERVTPRVDDRGVGKHQMDETNVAEVPEHLVDEVRSAQMAVRPGTRQVTRGARLDLLAVKRCDRLRVVQPLGGTGTGPHLERYGGDVRQLARAFDLRVARQHLLEQGRSRAWHPDDENRLPLLASPAATLVKKTGRVERQVPAEFPCHRPRIVEDSRALQRIAARVVLERGRELAGILERLA